MRSVLCAQRVYSEWRGLFALARHGIKVASVSTTVSPMLCFHFFCAFLCAFTSLLCPCLELYLLGLISLFLFLYCLFVVCLDSFFHGFFSPLLSFSFFLLPACGGTAESGCRRILSKDFMIHNSNPFCRTCYSKVQTSIGVCERERERYFTLIFVFILHFVRLVSSFLSFSCTAPFFLHFFTPSSILFSHSHLLSTSPFLHTFSQISFLPPH
jgi:hypothetical protein